MASKASARVTAIMVPGGHPSMPYVSTAEPTMIPMSSYSPSAPTVTTAEPESPSTAAMSMPIQGRNLCTPTTSPPDAMIRPSGRWAIVHDAKSNTYAKVLTVSTVRRLDIALPSEL